MPDLRLLFVSQFGVGTFCRQPSDAISKTVKRHSGLDPESKSFDQNDAFGFS
jgi:hypothetical protein